MKINPSPLLDQADNLYATIKHLDKLLLIGASVHKLFSAVNITVTIPFSQTIKTYLSFMT